MKRLLSWLLALVMIISCLPMSAIPAFAEETEIGVGDIQNPDFEGPIDKLDPVVIEEFAWTYTPAVQIAGDAEGNFYIYTAPADGVVTLNFTKVPEGVIEATYDENGQELTPESVKKYEGDIIVRVNDKVYSLKENGVNNYGLELQIPVNKGDVLEINTKLTADHQGNANPAGKYTWCGNFAYPAGSEQNPITIQWTWDDAYANATASVTVPEGKTQYFNGKAGMILTANGNVIEQSADGVFALAAGTYELKLATPVGVFSNPEVIKNINGFSDTVKLEAGGAYYYIWTATEDGTVTLDVTDGANITVDKLTYVEDSEWPTSEQFALAEPTVDENHNYTGWTVAENLAIEVVAGQQLKIQVNGLTDWATSWVTPAIEYTLTGSFEAAEPEVPEYVAPAVTFGSSMQSFLSLNDIIYFNINFDLIGTYDYTDEQFLKRFKLKVWNVDEDSPTTKEDMIVADADYIIDGAYYDVIKGRVTFKTEGIPAKNMSDLLGFLICYENNDGSYTYGRNHAGYAPSKYLMSSQMYKSADPSAKALAIALLNYGAQAQKYFNYRVDALMNAGLTAAEQVLAWNDSLIRTEYTVPAVKEGALARNSQVVTSRQGWLSLVGTIDTNIGAKAPSITLASDPVIYYWTEAEYNSLDVLTLENASSSETCVWDEYKGLWKGAYEGMAAKEMFGLIYGCIVFTDTNGNTYSAGVLPMSPERYCYSVRNNAVDRDIARAIVIYGDAARTYFS